MALRTSFSILFEHFNQVHSPISHHSYLITYLSYLISHLSSLRLPNLLIILLVMVGAQRIIYSAYGKFLLTDHFWLLCIGTMLIALAGNVINDYFDRHIDTMNKPNRVWVGKSVSVRAALWLYAAINALALVLVAWVAQAYLFPRWMLVLYPACILGLWVYSRWLKCTPLLGNLSVAAFCALVPIQVWWLANMQENLLATTLPESLVVYAAFAFLLTLWREVVKDLEDRSGDAAGGCRTLAVLSESKARVVALSLGILVFCLLVWVIFTQMPSEKRVMLVLCLLTPCGIAMNWLLKQGHKEYYSKASLLIKVVMVVGLVVMVA